MTRCISWPRRSTAAGAAESDKIREALYKTDFNGVMGPFTFTEGRDPASNAGVVVCL